MVFLRPLGLRLDGCNLEKVKASYRDGLLEIRIPRNAEALKVRKVPIEG